MRPDWWFNRGCLFDLGGWILDFQDQRTPQEYLEDMANGFIRNREKEAGSSEDDHDSVKDDENDSGSVEYDRGTVNDTESVLIFENKI